MPRSTDVAPVEVTAPTDPARTARLVIIPIRRPRTRWLVLAGLAAVAALFWLTVRHN